MSAILVEQFELDLYTEAESGTPSFGREEIQQAKGIVRARLHAEGIDKYKPSVRLIDDRNPDKTIVVLIGVLDDRVLANGELLCREYHIRNGTLFRIIKGYPNGGRLVTDIAAANSADGGAPYKLGANTYSARQIEGAQKIISEYAKDKYGWGVEQYDIVINSTFLNEHRQRSPLSAPAEFFLLSLHADPDEKPMPGGGNDLLFEVDMKTLTILREWAFQ